MYYSKTNNKENKEKRKKKQIIKITYSGDLRLNLPPLPVFLLHFDVFLLSAFRASQCRILPVLLCSIPLPILFFLLLLLSQFCLFSVLPSLEFENLISLKISTKCISGAEKR